jgi:hypothetical protein
MIKKGTILKRKIGLEETTLKPSLLSGRTNVTSRELSLEGIDF